MTKFLNPLTYLSISYSFSPCRKTRQFKDMATHCTRITVKNKGVKSVGRKCSVYIYIYICIGYRKPCFPKIRLFEARYKKGATFPRREKCERYRWRTVENSWTDECERKDTVCENIFAKNLTWLSLT